MTLTKAKSFVVSIVWDKNMPVSSNVSSTVAAEHSQQPKRRTCNCYSISAAFSPNRPLTSRRRPSQIRSRRRIAKAASEDTAAAIDDTVSTSGQYGDEISTGPPTSATWELDFSSRPVLDERGKKKWELLICSPDRSWQYSRWFPNNKINSTQVTCSSDVFLLPELHPIQLRMPAIDSHA